MLPALQNLSIHSTLTPSPQDPAESIDRVKTPELQLDQARSWPAASDSDGPTGPGLTESGAVNFQRFKQHFLQKPLHIKPYRGRDVAVTTVADIMRSLDLTRGYLKGSTARLWRNRPAGQDIDLQFAAPEATELPHGQSLLEWANTTLKSTLLKHLNTRLESNTTDEARAQPLLAQAIPINAQHQGETIEAGVKIRVGHPIDGGDCIDLVFMRGSHVPWDALHAGEVIDFCLHNKSATFKLRGEPLLRDWLQNNQLLWFWKGITGGLRRLSEHRCKRPGWTLLQPDIVAHFIDTATPEELADVHFRTLCFGYPESRLDEHQLWDLWCPVFKACHLTETQAEKQGEITPELQDLRQALLESTKCKSADQFQLLCSNPEGRAQILKGMNAIRANLHVRPAIKQAITLEPLPTDQHQELLPDALGFKTPVVHSVVRSLLQVPGLETLGTEQIQMLVGDWINYQLPLASPSEQPLLGILRGVCEGSDEARFLWAYERCSLQPRERPIPQNLQDTLLDHYAQFASTAPVTEQLKALVLLERVRLSANSLDRLSRMSCPIPVMPETTRAMTEQPLLAFIALANLLRSQTPAIHASRLTLLPEIPLPRSLAFTLLKGLFQLQYEANGLHAHPSLVHAFSGNKKTACVLRCGGYRFTHRTDRGDFIGIPESNNPEVCLIELGLHTLYITSNPGAGGESKPSVLFLGNGEMLQGGRSEDGQRFTGAIMHTRDELQGEAADLMTLIAQHFPEELLKIPGWGMPMLRGEWDYQALANCQHFSDALGAFQSGTMNRMNAQFNLKVELRFSDGTPVRMTIGSSPPLLEPPMFLKLAPSGSMSDAELLIQKDFIFDLPVYRNPQVHDIGQPHWTIDTEAAKTELWYTGSKGQTSVSFTGPLSLDSFEVSGVGAATWHGNQGLRWEGNLQNKQLLTPGKLYIGVKPEPLYEWGDETPPIALSLALVDVMVRQKTMQFPMPQHVSNAIHTNEAHWPQADFSGFFSYRSPDDQFSFIGHQHEGRCQGLLKYIDPKSSKVLFRMLDGNFLIRAAAIDSPSKGPTPKGLERFKALDLGDGRVLIPHGYGKHFWVHRETHKLSEHFTYYHFEGLKFLMTATGIQLDKQRIKPLAEIDYMPADATFFIRLLAASEAAQGPMARAPSKSTQYDITTQYRPGVDRLAIEPDDQAKLKMTEKQASFIKTIRETSGFQAALSYRHIQEGKPIKGWKPAMGTLGFPCGVTYVGELTEQGQRLQFSGKGQLSVGGYHFKTECVGNDLTDIEGKDDRSKLWLDQHALEIRSTLQSGTTSAIRPSLPRLLKTLLGEEFEPERDILQYLFTGSLYRPNLDQAGAMRPMVDGVLRSTFVTLDEQRVETALLLHSDNTPPTGLSSMAQAVALKSSGKLTATKR